MRRILSLAITIILFCAYVAVLPAFADETEVQLITVTDQAGREVLVETPAERIVSCYYISTASLIALGLRDNLVGIEMMADTRGLYKLAASEIIDLPAVGSGKGVNVEEIAALSPDVVILPLRLKDDADTLESLGIPVLLVNPETQEDFEACIRLLGVVSGKYEEAQALLARSQAVTSELSEKLADVERPSVYLAAGSDFYTTYPAGLYQDDLITIAGGINVAAGMEGDSKVTVDAEQLLSWDPDYIFVVADADYTVDDVVSDPQLAALSAVSEGRVYVFPSNIEPWDYPTCSSVLGQLFMASRIHPDIITEEYFTDEAISFYADTFEIEISPEDLGL